MKCARSIVVLYFALAGCGQHPPAVIAEPVAQQKYDPFQPTTKELNQKTAVQALKPTTPAVLSDQQKLRITAYIRSTMKDPSSTRIGDIASGHDGTGATAFCVWVNSKNSYGGYTGAKPMAGKLSAQTVEEFDFDVYGYDLHAVCKALGLELAKIRKPT
ncbi:MAG: hypothetical protein HOO99_04040 [Hyphomicrobiaceae bacterium]|nr:hypothetical protein [Hyphomicrobiaceae bacterium]